MFALMRCHNRREVCRRLRSETFAAVAVIKTGGIVLPKNIACRAAAFIIKDNKLLFAKNVNSPYYYLVGGGIEENESSEETVIREIFEETGLTLEVDKLVMVQERFHEVDNQKHHEIVFFYLVKDNGNIDISDNTFTDQGTDETLHWFPTNRLDEFNVVPKFLPKYLKTKSFNDIETIEHVIIRE
jgi:ADP-ribose pyrophosphatase YjhB (NUDIX family)